MKKAFILIFVCLAGCNGKSSTESAPPPPAEKPAPAPAPAPVAFSAANAYTTVCATCHGANGDGTGPGAAALDPKPASFITPGFWKTRDRDYVIKVIKEGGAAVGKSPLMAAFGAAFSDEQIAELADHIMAFKAE